MSNKVAIINVALARLGTERISSTSENNKRARMASTFYDSSLRYLLSVYDWSFARKETELAQLTLDDPVWNYIYQLPSDCIQPIEILPYGSLASFEVRQDTLLCNYSPVYLLYTFLQENSALFPGFFVDALSAKLAAEMATAIVQDKNIYGQLLQLADAKAMIAMEADAQRGNVYRRPDLDSNYDSFVNPDISTELLGWDNGST